MAPASTALSWGGLPLAQVTSIGRVAVVAAIGAVALVAVWVKFLEVRALSG